MNAKQSLRAASARIIELEDYNKRAAADIARYNEVIIRLIMGDCNPCDYCEDQNECQLQAKHDRKGCGDWWLRYEVPPEQNARLIMEGEPVAGAWGDAQ